MKKIIQIILSVLVMLPLSSSLAFAQNQVVIDGKGDGIEEIVNKIERGEKVPLEQTMPSGQTKTKRYVVFTKKDSYQKSKKNVSNLKAAQSIIDNTTYGEVKAIPVDLTDKSKAEINEFLITMYKDEDVVAITPVATREISAVPTFNDPLFPTGDSYLDSKQWYLSRPVSGYFGIDMNRAWNYIDSLGRPYGGSSDVVVAVIDTGAAYESYSKYHQFEKMSDPSPWVFSKSPDFTDNIFTNSSETANNQIDDDNNNSYISYCIDKNLNGVCDSNEALSFIDDYNGLNIYDWGRYWSRATFEDIANSSVCSNEPYNSAGVKCVQNPTYQSLCSTNGLSNSDYYGCFASDMGHPNDVFGHGTFISNIISAKPNNGVSGVGIAPGISLMNIKIFGEYYNSTYSSWVHDSALGDQVANAINYAVQMGVDVINLSFAGSEIDIYEKLAIDNAYYNNDILVVAASGNWASSTAWYPAGYSSVLSVGASNKDGTRASYSNYGTSVEMVAPVGGGIIGEGYYKDGNDLLKNCSWNSSLRCIDGDPMGSPSIFSSFGNFWWSGTSFAAPQVVAVAALLKSTYPNLTASQIRYILKMSAMSFGSYAFSTSTGNGVLNANNALLLKNYKGVDLTEVSRTYQMMVNKNYYPYTRFSDNGGVTWSSWIKSGNRYSAGNLSILEDPSGNGKVFQLIKGTNSGVYVRYADNFGYTDQTDSQWSGWTGLGKTLDSYSAVWAGSNLVVAYRGTDKKIYTKYSTDKGVSWNLSSTPNVSFLGSVKMLYESNSGKMVQLAWASDGYIYTRTSSDFGVNWGGWTKGPDKLAKGGISAIVVGNNVVRTVRIASNVAITRYSPDGGTTWIGRNREYGKPGIAKNGVSLTYDQETDTLVSTYRGGDNQIYSKYSTNKGVSWSPISAHVNLPTGVAASSGVSVSDGNKLALVKGSNSYVYYRRSTDGGRTWSKWRNKGSLKTAGEFSAHYNKSLNHVIMTIRYTDRRIYQKMSNDGGNNFNSWYVSGKGLSGVSDFGVVMDNMDTSFPID